MKSLDEYYEMGAANFNLVLDPESRFAAEELKDRLGMPYVELARLYDPERIHRQYQYFAAGIGVKMDDAEIYEEALSKRDDFAKRYKGKTFAVGEMANANPFELALSLICMGMSVKYIYSNVTENDFIYIDKLAEVSPDTRVFTGISPSMINYEGTFDVDISIGKDAGSYCRGSVNVPWMSEEQPFGFRGFIKLIDAIDESVIDMRGENNERII